MSPAALVLAAAAALFPAFQPTAAPFPEPLLWETPVSWELPAAGPPEPFFSPEAAAQKEALRRAESESGPAGALAFLAKASEPEPLLWRAGLKARTGDWPGAQADYRTVLDSPDRGRLRALALEGYKAALRQRIAAGEKALYGDLIQTLKDEWRNEEALALLPVILADPGTPEATRALVRRQEPIMALRLGQYDRAAELWGNPSGRSESQWLSQAEYRRGRFAEAAGIRLELAKKNPAGRARLQELSTAFNILTRGGLFREAGELAAQYPELKKTTDYNWRLGLAALAVQDLKAAESFFETVLKDGKDKKRHPGARYYLGRTLALAGRNREARTAYEALAAGPVNYYHILARGRLRPSAFNSAALMERLLITGPSGRDRDSLGFHLWITEKSFDAEGLEAAAAALSEAGSVLAEGRNRAGRALNDELKKLLVERDWEGLAEFVRRHENAVKNPSTAARERWLPLAAGLAARHGDYRLAFSLLARSPARPGTVGKWSHPLVYSREVLAARREHGLSPALVLALIRTESAYQPDIISASNARGLMQLLPATAEKVAARLGRLAPDAAELFDPAANVRYGSWYLRALIDGFGDETLALAGYNGGPYNIRSLILAKPDLPLDLFIDTLPIEETIRYVQRITEARYRYEMSYLGQARLPDLSRTAPRPNSGLPDF